MNRPNKVEALPGFRIRVTYPDGVEGVIDLSADVGRGVFALLADEKFFFAVHIGSCGQIAWTKEIEICPDAAYQEIKGNDFLRHEAAHGKREDFERFLAAVPHLEPSETDRSL